MECVMDVQGKIVQGFKNVDSDNVETRKDGWASILEATLTMDGIAALQQNHFEALEKPLEAGDRQLAATCLCRILCSNLTAEKTTEWDKKRLRDLHKIFDRSTRREVKEKILKAVRLFAIAHDQGPGLLQETSWLETALSNRAASHQGAVLLLDALQGLERLPGAIIKSAGSAHMLSMALWMFKEPERLAALRVASHVMICLKQGLSGVTQREEQLWLASLHKAGIVTVLFGCIEQHFTEALDDSALRVRTELAQKDDKFLKELVEAGAVRVLAKKALAKRASDSILVLVRRLLMSGSFITALAKLGPSGIEVSEVCLTALDAVDPAAAKSILGSVKRWVLWKLRDGSHQMVEAAAGLVTSLAHSSRDIADDLVMEGAFHILSMQIAAKKHLHATPEDHVPRVVSATARLVQKADPKLVSDYCIAADEGFPEVRRLLKVSDSLPEVRQAQVLHLLAEIVHKFPGALDATLEAECVQHALTVLGCMPHDDAAKLLMDTLVLLLKRARASLGQTFNKANGPELLHHHLAMGPDRNGALMVVMTIATNAELAKVVDHLAAIAGSPNLASLFEDYPPLANAAKEQTAWRNWFKTAFQSRTELVNFWSLMRWLDSAAWQWQRTVAEHGLCHCSSQMTSGLHLIPSTLKVLRPCRLRQEFCTQIARQAIISNVELVLEEYSPLICRALL